MTGHSSKELWCLWAYEGRFFLRTVLPDPAPPLCLAPRPELHVVGLCFNFDKCALQACFCHMISIDQRPFARRLSKNKNHQWTQHSFGCIRLADKSATCLVQNPDIPQAGRVGAHGRLAGRGRAGLHANKAVRLGKNPFS